MLRALQKKAETRRLNVAIRFGSHEITYERLLDAVDRLATGLGNLGLTKGDQVAIMLPNLPQFVIAYFALSKIGATVVLIDPNLSSDHLRHVFYITRLKACLALDSHVNRLNEVSHPNSGLVRIFLGDNVPSGCVNLTELIATAPHSARPHIDVETEDPAMIGFTTGTSGKPRGVCFTTRSLETQVYSAQRTLQLTPQDSVACPSSFAELTCTVPGFIAPLVSGSRLLLFPQDEPKQACQVISSMSNVLLLAAPDFFANLLQLQDIEDIAEQIRLCVCNCNELSSSLLDEAQKRLHVTMQRCYALPEAGLLTLTENGLGETETSNLGLPALGVEIRIADKSGRKLPAETIGEIQLRYDGLMSGYLKGNGETPHLFIDGWFRSGDFGRFDLLGRLYYLGPRRQIIFKGGFEVVPSEVQQVLLMHPGIQACSVFGVRNGALGSEVQAKVVPVNGQSLSTKEIIAFCQERLANYKCPRFIEIADSLNVESKGRVN